jgi:hypothetical protein
VSFRVQCVGPDLFAHELARANLDVSELSVSSLSIATAGWRPALERLSFNDALFLHTMILVGAVSDIYDTTWCTSIHS